MTVDEYLTCNLDIVSVVGDEARLVRCLFCGRPRTMKVNLRNHRWFCYHDDCRKAGALPQLIQVIEDCDQDRAYQIVDAFVRDVVRSTTVEETARLFDGGGEPETDDKVMDSGLPEGFIPCWNGKKYRIPQYLLDRRIPKEQIRRWGIGYCDSGVCAGRVVVPVRCAGMVAWVARDATGEAQNRYMTPRLGVVERVLFGFDEIPQGARIILVEGVFDAIRLCSYGLHAAAYLTSGLSEHQIGLLGRARPSEAVLMPDALDKNAQERVIRTALRLSVRFPTKVAFLGEDTEPRPDWDPDSAPREEVFRAIRQAVGVASRMDVLELLDRL